MYFDTVLKALEQLLKDESINQGNLGGLTWTTTRERFDPWNVKADKFPLVNITYNAGSFDEGRGSQTDQTHGASYILDCYASANAFAVGTSITPKDQRAADVLHELITRVYYTVMSEINRDIGLPAGKIVTPWVNRIEKFIPTESNVPIEGVIAARLTVSMSFQEFPPTNTGVPLSVVNITTDTSDGALVEQQFENLDT